MTQDPELAQPRPGGAATGSAPAVDHDPEAVWELHEHVGLVHEVGRLRELLDAWADAADPEAREMLRYQLAGRAKHFRPVTMFACHRAATGAPTPERVVQLAAAIELFHNYTLVIDDIVDRDRYRRGQLTLHCRYGSTPAIAVGAYLAYGAAGLIHDDEYACRVFMELGERIVVAECRQWRVRRRALGVDEWRRLAGEDTGAMFEACARAAVRDGTLDRFAYLLGTLYHGCDDVADIRGTLALGTESEKDVTDRILTLPAAIATLDPATRELYEQGGPEVDEELAERLTEALAEAEAVLDAIAREAEDEARGSAAHPDGLVRLVRYTRALSAV